MIELRWVQENNYIADILSMPTKKLQYRRMTNFMELGLSEPIWSEWLDVPTVKGE